MPFFSSFWVTAERPSTVNTVEPVSYSTPETNTLPKPVIGPEETLATMPVPPMPPPSWTLGLQEAAVSNRLEHSVA